VVCLRTVCLLLSLVQTGDPIAPRISRAREKGGGAGSSAILTRLEAALTIVTAICLSVALFLLLAAPADAATERTPRAQAELISESTSIASGRPFWLALKFRIEKHWHTYWKNPGDSGLPATIVWDLPPGFEAGPVEWPYPHRFQVGPIVNFGYEDEVLLLTEVRPPASVEKKNARIAARAKWLVCKDVCIPEQANLEISLPISAEPPKANLKHSDNFAKARAKLPVKLKDWWELKAELQNNIVVLSLKPQTNSRVDTAGLTFFPDQEGWMDNAARQLVTRDADGFELRIKTAAPAPESVNGVLVAPHGWSTGHNAVEINVPIK
jgi:DsbC/DsbD-like thiol-disulfide interchange protein